MFESQAWYMPIMLAPQEAEVEGLQIQGQPGQLIQILSQNKIKFSNRLGIQLSGRMLVLHVQGPRFNPITTYTLYLYICLSIYLSVCIHIYTYIHIHTYVYHTWCLENHLTMYVQSFQDQGFLSSMAKICSQYQNFLHWYLIK